MNSLRYVIALVALAALAFTLPAQAATSDPEVVLYRGSGVVDNGGATATSFACTPFSGVGETIRVVVRAQNGSIAANQAGTVAHLATVVFSTGEVGIFADGILNTGAVAGGTVAIAATSTSVSCTAMLIQPNTTAPVGVQLHMIRFNPLAGTAE